MTNPIKDQAKFMKACGQSVGKFNSDQFDLYVNLINEEHTELKDAIAAGDKVETLDALIDIIVVTVGAMHSLGVDAEGAWKEIMGSNFAKINRETGMVEKREDGKVLKPEHWMPPQLKQFIVTDEN
jgi:predicted HAD superfamily Cof-like phosphohydrolase